jgi:hypothetical protein
VISETGNPSSAYAEARSISAVNTRRELGPPAAPPETASIYVAVLVIVAFGLGVALGRPSTTTLSRGTQTTVLTFKP